jgi:hypothetical protein
MTGEVFKPRPFRQFMTAMRTRLTTESVQTHKSSYVQ